MVFKQRYTQLNEVWTKKFGWPIFLILHEADAHIVKQFRVPLSENLGEFDNQLVYLTKLLVDSLNENELAKACGGAFSDEKSISKLRRYLDLQRYPYVDRDIRLLRNLQELRSSGAVHHKGKNYVKISAIVGLDRNSSRSVFRDLLSQVNKTLTDLATHFAPTT